MTQSKYIWALHVPIDRTVEPNVIYHEMLRIESHPNCCVGYMIFDDILTIVTLQVVDCMFILAECIVCGEMDPNTTWFD